MYCFAFLGFGLIFVGPFSVFFVPAVEKLEEFVFGCFFFYFLLFSTQNQVSQIIIGIGRVIYHIKAILVAIRMKFKNFEKKFSVFRKKFLLRFFITPRRKNDTNFKRNFFILGENILCYLHSNRLYLLSIAIYSSYFFPAIHFIEYFFV